MNVRKGDTVLVLAGKDRGKRGTVDRVQRTKRGFGVVIPGINMAKRHQRCAVADPAGRHHRPAGAASRQQRAGRLPALRPADARRPQQAARASTRQRTRVCKRCGEQIEVTTK